MSHISAIEVKVSDLAAFEAACLECGVEFRREQKTFRNYSGRKSPCEMAVAVPNNQHAYELGLVKTADGKAYSIQMDNYLGGKGLNELVGYDAGKLRQLYGIHAATNAAKKQNMNVQRQQMPDGSIRLVCEPKQQVAQAQAGMSGY